MLERAQRVIPGGVNSSLRRLCPGYAITGADGQYLHTADGRTLVDYHAAFGPLVLGHRHPAVEAAAAKALETVDLVGVGVTELEVEAAERIVAHVPSAEKVVFTNSGSEATYSAIRLARAVTGRRKLIKFQGCYHGWHDSVALNVISPAERIGSHDPLSAGSSPAELADTLVCRFNDLASVQEAFASCDGGPAAVIVEPIQHNIGAVLPQPGFLEGLRELCTRSGALLIFDEVITGIRHGLGGFQAACGVMPDLTCLGKALANGYPVAALAGPAALMDQLGTAGGPVFFAGTFNGHPASMAAICATIDTLLEEGVLAQIFDLGERVRSGLAQLARRHRLDACVSGYGSVFVLYFTAAVPTCYEDLLANDADRYVAFHQGLIDRGHFLLPMNLKRSNVSAAHTTRDIEQLLDDADGVLARLAAG